MRGPKVRKLEGINDYDFKQLAKTKGSPRERQRYLAFAHIQAVAAVMVSYSS